MDEEERYWRKLERVYVHDVYESISCQYDEFLKFNKMNQSADLGDDDNDAAKENEAAERASPSPSNTLTPELPLKTPAKLKKKIRQRRVVHKAWPNVTNFLLQLEPYSLVADIGCGDGKYLNLNKAIMTIGADRSSSLCNLAGVKYQPFGTICDRNQLAVCDNLALPFRSEMFDAVISIGVIHHFSSPKRRIQAVKELARILRPGGKIMIYVWAMEQRVRKFNSQDVLVPMIDTKSMKASLPSKFLLQRNLSNNSTAYSDESNEETETLNQSLGTDTQKSILKAGETNGLGSPEADASQTSLSSKNLDLNVSTSSESVRISDNEKTTPRIDESPVIETPDKSSPNRTFISNVKQFLTKRFSSVNLKEIQKIKQEIDSKALKNQSSNSLNGSSVFNMTYMDPMERYRQILEDHKDLLPKDFTIRNFPHSSCEGTFDDKGDTQTPPSDESSKKEIKITFDLNSNAVEAEDESPVKSEAPTPIADSGNSSNKRFYHVFKKNELDELIRENCTDLVMMSSFNDHGNWCWVGYKSERE